MTTAEASLSPPFSAVVFFLKESFAKPPLSSEEVAVDSPQWARKFGSGATRSERPAGYPKLTKRRDKERRLPFRAPTRHRLLLRCAVLKKFAMERADRLVGTPLRDNASQHEVRRTNQI